MSREKPRQVVDPVPSTSTTPDPATAFQRVSLRLMFNLLTEVRGKLPGDSLMLDLFARFESTFNSIFPHADEAHKLAFKGFLVQVISNAHAIAPLENPADLQKKVLPSEGPVMYGLGVNRGKIKERVKK
jgi:hypothetical protein